VGKLQLPVILDATRAIEHDFFCGINEAVRASVPQHNVGAGKQSVPVDNQYRPPILLELVKQKTNVRSIFTYIASWFGVIRPKD